MLFSRPGIGSTFVIWLPDRALSQLGGDTSSPPHIDPVSR